MKKTLFPTLLTTVAIAPVISLVGCNDPKPTPPEPEPEPEDRIVLNQYLQIECKVESTPTKLDAIGTKDAITNIEKETRYDFVIDLTARRFEGVRHFTFAIMCLNNGSDRGKVPFKPNEYAFSADGKTLTGLHGYPDYAGNIDFKNQDIDTICSAKKIEGYITTDTWESDLPEDLHFVLYVGTEG